MRYALITDKKVERLHGRRLCQSLYAKGYEVELFSFPSGERFKTRNTKERLENRLLRRGFGRDTVIIGLGGGVVTDLAGFLASTFCRGVPLILIPTTLLAMVDASIGGKTGVNTVFGKNLIGTFYRPKSVVLNLEYLTTLEQVDWFNGKVEMLKVALIADADFAFRFHKTELKEAIHKSISIKQHIVNSDPFEKKGNRALLNLGHTLGHAMETASGYTLSHGMAVAMGINLESRIAYEMGLLPKCVLDQVVEWFPMTRPIIEKVSIIQALKSDKKSLMGKPQFTFLTDIGKAIIGIEVPSELIERVLS